VIKQDLLENQAKLIYLAVGSNLGNKIHNIEKTKSELQLHEIKIIKCSSYFETESWPDRTNPKFNNIVIEATTNLSPLKLLSICKLIERKLGRKKGKKNSPRLCDIDIIDYDHKILNLNDKNLVLPHPKMAYRNFVLFPLFEINKCWKHPKSGKNIVNLINVLPIKDLRSIKQI